MRPSVAGWSPDHHLSCGLLARVARECAVRLVRNQPLQSSRAMPAWARSARHLVEHLYRELEHSPGRSSAGTATRMRPRETYPAPTALCGRAPSAAALALIRGASRAASTPAPAPSPNSTGAAVLPVEMRVKDFRADHRGSLCGFPLFRKLSAWQVLDVSPLTPPQVEAVQPSPQACPAEQACSEDIVRRGGRHHGLGRSGGHRGRRLPPGGSPAPDRSALRPSHVGGNDAGASRIRLAVSGAPRTPGCPSRAPQ